MWFGESPTRNYLSATTNYLAIYQYVSHAAIAFNRYRTIASSDDSRSVRSFYTD